MKEVIVSDDVCYQDLNWLMDKVREFKLQHPEALDGQFEFLIDYTCCYYESDILGIKLIWHPPVKKA